MPLTDTEFAVQLGTTVITNLCLFPTAKLCWENRMYAAFWSGLFAFITSLTYHYLNTVNAWLGDDSSARVWGMNELTWHQLDNIFSLVCLQLTAVIVMQNEDPKTDNLLGWFFSHTTVIVQVRAPWNEVWSFGPVALALLVLVVGCWRRGRWPQLAQGDLRKALAIMGGAFFFFIKGLDDQNDYLRMYHGMWHACVGGFTYYLFRAGLPWRKALEERQTAKLP